MTYEPVSVESLLAHQNWALRLARRLVREDGEAEDLVQRTWVAALRHPPDSERGARAWIRKVLLNLARERHRRGRTRQHYEHSFPRTVGDVPDTLEVLSREEIQKLLSEQLLELGEPYRSVVLQRYYDGLSSVEIARRSGVPAGTVRWRLKVGLDQLRAVLDRRSGGDRSRWVSALLLFTQPGIEPSGPGGKESVAPESASAPALGPTVLGTPAWLALAGACALGLFFVTRGLEARSGVADVVRAGSRATPAPPAATDEATRVARDVEREPLSADPGSAMRAVAAPEGLSILVVDVSGAPMSAARILVAGANGFEERARCDAEGRATLVVLPHDPGALGLPAIRGRVGVRALAEGREASDLVHVAPPFTSAHEVRLVVGGPETLLTGRVIDSEGRAVPGAVVACFDVEKRLERAEGDFASPSFLSATSDAEGGFVLANLPAQGTLGCFADGFSFASQALLPSRHGPIEFILERGARLSGIVRLPDGRPVANAIVGCEPLLKSAEWATGLPRYDADWRGFGEVTRSDANGRYRLEGVKAGRERLLWAREERTGLVATAWRRLEDDQEDRWDPELSERTGFRLRLVDETGTALPGWVVHLRCTLQGGSWWVRKRATDGEGRLRIPDCPEGGTSSVFFVDVFSPVDVGASYASRQLQLSADEYLVQVETRVASSVRGCLLDDLGVPLEDGQLVLRSLRTTLETPVSRDERGCFEQRLASGSYWLVFKLEHTAARVEQFKLVPGGDRQLGTITLPALGTLRLDPSGLKGGPRPLSYSLFSLGDTEEDRSVLRVSRGPLDGERLLAMFAGRYQLLAFDGTGGKPHAHEFRVEPHAETRLDLGR